MQFALADLCGYFASFAVRLFYRKERKDSQSVAKEFGDQVFKVHQYSKERRVSKLYRESTGY